MRSAALAALLLFRQRFRRAQPHRRNRILQRVDQRTDHSRAGVLIERLGRGLAHGRVRVAQSLDQQRDRAFVGDFGQFEHGHAPHAGVFVRAARSDIVEVGIESVEQSHGLGYRSR